jgi:glycerol-3-phosphate dehydrogenase
MRRSGSEELRGTEVDVLILGGGINGAGVARDLALRARSSSTALRILLVEQNHFASGTSGKNSQLIHGGLRYLKYFEFHLVREALRERATLLSLAPHLVEPLPLLIPFYNYFDRLLYSAGIALYSLLAGKHKVGKVEYLSAGQTSAIEPSMELRNLRGGAVYYDCLVNSARFVLENLQDAYANGARLANYMRAESCAKTADGWWQVELHDRLNGMRFAIRARKIVDTLGAWSDEAEELRLVRGSHIVIPRPNQSDRAIAFFGEDGRIVFMIPWGNNVALVGTTEVDHKEGPDRVEISAEEAAYLQGVVRRVFPEADTTLISSFSALRPLLRDDSASASSTSREHRIWASPNGVVHVCGGKYTTYRIMSEQAVDLLTHEIAPSLEGLHLTALTPLAAPKRPDDSTMIRFAVEQEMAQTLRDLLYVSTYWGYEKSWTPNALRPFAAVMGERLGWSAAKVEREIASVESAGC